MWDSATGACLRVMHGHTASVSGMCAVGDKYLVSGSSDKEVRVWDVATGACLHIMTGFRDWVWPIVALPGGRFAAGSADSTIRIGNPVTGVWERTLEGHSRYVYGLAVLPDGRLVSGSYDQVRKGRARGAETAWRCRSCRLLLCCRRKRTTARLVVAVWCSRSRSGTRTPVPACARWRATRAPSTPSPSLQRVSGACGQ